MEISLEHRVVAPEDVMFRDLDGEAVLLNLDNESYYGLDNVGTRIWQVLTSSLSIQMAIDALVGEFDVDRDQLKADVLALVGELRKDGLVRVEDASLA